MNDKDRTLPPDLAAQFRSFLRETDGEFEVVEMEGFVAFVAEYGDRYPFLLDLVSINEEAMVDHFHQTGELPPGVKLVRKTTESEKVTRFEVFHGPIPREKE